MKPAQKRIDEFASNHIKKSDALDACNKCTKSMKALCPFRKEIELSGGELQDPPQCIIEFVSCMRTNQVSKGDSIRTNHLEQLKTVPPTANEPKTQQSRNGKTNQSEHSKKEKGSLSVRAAKRIPTKLTKTEQEYITLISQGITNKNKIASIRNCTPRAVQKVFKQLKKKGILNSFNEIVRFVEGYSEQSPTTSTVLSETPYNPEQPHAQQGGAGLDKVKRLHGWQVLITILHRDERYAKSIGTAPYIKNNYVSLNREVVQIGGNTDFYNNDPAIAFMDLVRYLFEDLIPIIENDYGITLVKDRKANIKFVKGGEYGEVGNEIAIQCRQEGEKIKIIGDDGKVWFICDNSWNLDEAETCHAQEALRDSRDVLSPYFNDIRAHAGNIPKPSEGWRLQHELQDKINEIGAGLAVIVNIEKRRAEENEKKKEAEEGKKEPETKHPLHEDDYVHIYG